MSSNVNTIDVIKNMFITLSTIIPNHRVQNCSKENLTTIVLNFIMNYHNYDNMDDRKNEINIFMNILYSGLLDFKIVKFLNDKEIEHFFIDILNKISMKQKLIISTKLFQLAVDKYNDENKNLKEIFETLDFISLFTKSTHKTNKRSSKANKLNGNNDCDISVTLPQKVEKKDQEENANKKNPKETKESFKNVKCIAIINPIENSSNGGNSTLFNPTSEIKVELIKEKNDLINILENGDFLLINVEFNEMSEPHIKTGKLMAYDHNRPTNHTEVYALRSSSITFRLNNKIEYICESIVDEGLKFYDNTKKSKKMIVLMDKAGENLKHKDSETHLFEVLRNVLIQKKYMFSDWEVSVKIYDKIDHPILKQFDGISFGSKKLTYFEEYFEVKKVSK